MLTSDMEPFRALCWFYCRHTDWRSCSNFSVFASFQLQSRFEQLKRLHADEKAALEEKKKLLEEDQSLFSKRRATAQLLQAQSLTANGKKDKDRKK